MAVGLILPYVNIQGMQLHLAEISANTPDGRFAVVVLDQAGWHTSQKINIFNNILVLPLPPASPELNPQEQVWQWLRRHELANRCFKNYDDIVNACCDAWNSFVNQANRVRNLCSRDWACLMT